MARSWPALAIVLAYVSVAASVVISTIWFAMSPGWSWFEPALQALGLVACLSGVTVERRAAGRERRRAAMTALLAELAQCAAILEDPRFGPRQGVSRRPCVYPRLPVSAADSVLVADALGGHRDADLRCRLYAWRDAAKEFNRRLDLTELRLFTVGRPEEIRQFERVLNRADGYVYELRLQAGGLLDHLAAGGRERRRSTRPRFFGIRPVEATALG